MISCVCNFHSAGDDSTFLRFLRPSVFQGDRPVENQFWQMGVGSWELGIFIQRKVGEALKLITNLRSGIYKRRFEFCRHYFERVRVEDGFEIASVAFRLGFGEEAVIKAHFGIYAMRGADPMDRAFDL